MRNLERAKEQLLRVHKTDPDMIVQACIFEIVTTQVERALAMLSPKEKEILRLRFGIGEEGEHTLEEVGKRFAVTRERIRQIEAKALRKLRHPSRSRKLKDYLE